MPGGWVTLQDVYRCTIDAELFARKIGAARDLVARLCPVRVTVAGSDLFTHKESLEDWAWEPVAGTEKATCRLDPGLRDRLAELGVAYDAGCNAHLPSAARAFRRLPPAHAGFGGDAAREVGVVALWRRPTRSRTTTP